MKFWKKDYFGLPISQNLISEIWSDFIPVYHSGHLLRFNYVDESDEIQFTFLDVYSKTDLPPLKKSRLSNDFDDSTGFFQYFDDSEVFKDCYEGGKKVHFKYVHELQDILEKSGIRRCIYGGLSFPEDIECDF